MSNLSSIFDVKRGFPNGSGLHFNYKEKDAVTPVIPEGTVVAVEDESGVPVVDRHTSVLDSSGNLDHPWLVVRGKDETDAEETDKLACVKLRTGVLFRIATSDYPLPGDPVYANAGVVTLTQPASGPAFGYVTEYNPSAGWMEVES